MAAAVATSAASEQQAAVRVRFERADAPVALQGVHRGTGPVAQDRHGVAGRRLALGGRLVVDRRPRRHDGGHFGIEYSLTCLRHGRKRQHDRSGERPDRD